MPMHSLTQKRIQMPEVKAITHYETALQLDPSMFWAHYSLGAIYKKQEKDDQALSKFQTCLTLNPKSYPAHYYIGEIPSQTRQSYRSDPNPLNLHKP